MDADSGGVSVALCVGALLLLVFGFLGTCSGMYTYDSVDSTIELADSDSLESVLGGLASCQHSRS